MARTWTKPRDIVGLGAGRVLQPGTGYNHHRRPARCAPTSSEAVGAGDMPIEEHSIDKIIAAVSSKYVPANLDRSALRRAIDESEKYAKIISVNRRGARARKRIRRLKQIRETAEQLASLLEVKDDASDMIENLWPKSARRLGEWPLATVSRLIVGLVEASEHALSDPEPRRWGNPTANEWLAGAELPCVFKEHFHRKPGGSRNKTHKKGGGPCVRFIEAAMRELGVRYSPASILRTMTRLRDLRDQRRLVRQGKVTYDLG